MLTRTETVKPKVVNGINVDDLFALIEGVRSDVAKAKTHWRVDRTGRARRGAVRTSTASRSVDNRCRANSRSTSTSLASSVVRIGSPTPRSICWRRLTPA